MTAPKPIPIIAAGIDAETVIPTLSPRYAFAAPNTSVRMTPVMIEVAVSSGSFCEEEMYDLKFFV